MNKYDPNYSLMRATVNRGEDAKDNGKFGLSHKGVKQLMKLFMTKESILEDKRIDEVFTKEVFDSNF
ncbi:hypothetical protein FACS1894152_2780 [Bacilli bacterium]|nr:hypothetical protein FACS1894152_2780 [Bacilli bacterium]GHU32422.1 hypothetical protein FACS1894166_05710 [Bacilli bacterium]